MRNLKDNRFHWIKTGDQDWEVARWRDNCWHRIGTAEVLPDDDGFEVLVGIRQPSPSYRRTSGIGGTPGAALRDGRYYWIGVPEQDWEVALWKDGCWHRSGTADVIPDGPDIATTTWLRTPAEMEAAAIADTAWRRGREHDNDIDLISGTIGF